MIRLKMVRSLMLLFAVGLVILLSACSTVPSIPIINPIPTIQQSPTIISTNPLTSIPVPKPSTVVVTVPPLNNPPSSIPALKTFDCRSNGASSNQSAEFWPVTRTVTIPPSPTPLSSTLEVYFLDVGQGDSEILRVGNSTMLIDAGTNAITTSLIKRY